jgi:hypothetical protein
MCKMKFSNYQAKQRHALRDRLQIGLAVHLGAFQDQNRGGRTTRAPPASTYSTRPCRPGLRRAGSLPDALLLAHGFAPRVAHVSISSRRGRALAAETYL